jgi:hypothetical protein
MDTASPRVLDFSAGLFLESESDATQIPSTRPGVGVYLVTRKTQQIHTTVAAAGNVVSNIAIPVYPSAPPP